MLERVLLVIDLNTGHTFNEGLYQLQRATCAPLEAFSDPLSIALMLQEPNTAWP